MPDVEGRKKAPQKDVSRRTTIQTHVGEVPVPDTSESNYLLNIFFEFGPATKDGPIGLLEIEAWSRALGVKFKPWQTRLFVQLSRAYCAAQFESTKPDTPCPWPEAEKLWSWARNQKAEKALDREEKRLARKAAKLEK